MAITVDRENRIPAYIQIRNQLREQILRGDLPRGTRLPPERKMARRLIGQIGRLIVAAGSRLERFGSSAEGTTRKRECSV